MERGRGEDEAEEEEDGGRRKGRKRKRAATGPCSKECKQGMASDDTKSEKLQNIAIFLLKTPGWID